MRWLTPAKWLCPQRSFAKEMLDAPDIPAAQLRENLDDLRRVNRYLGSRHLVLRTLWRLWRQSGRPSSWQILDIGTGAGDIPVAIASWGRRHAVHVRIVALDYHAGVLQQTRTLLLKYPEISPLHADALRLPFAPGTFDIVMCSSMLHHLTWQEGLFLLRAMAQVARVGIVVNDLVRHTLLHYGAKLLLPLLARNQLTQHDGALSVLRAYTVAEAREMARVAGLQEARIRRVLQYRWLLVYTHPPIRIAS